MDELWETVNKTFADNEFFQGGLLAGIFTGVIMYARSIPATIQGIGQKWATISVEIQNDSEHFKAVARYFSELFEGSKRGHFACVATGTRNVMVPLGTRWMRHGSSLIRVSFEKRELESKGYSNNAAVDFSVHLRAYGPWRKTDLDSLVHTAVQRFKRKERQLRVKYNSPYGGFEEGAILPNRNFQNVYIEDPEEFIEELDEFMASKEEYEAKGIPWRRNYLMYGPPGTGKTSLSAAIAQHMGRDLNVISFSGLTDQSMRQCLSKDNLLLLIEDIDAGSANVGERFSGDRDGDGIAYADEQRSSLTLAGILNAIDGVGTGQGSVLLMTTNHIEKIDPALVRPGRIHKRIEMGYVTQATWRRMCQNWYGVDGGTVPGYDFTSAYAQEVMLENKNDFTEFKNQIIRNRWSEDVAKQSGDRVTIGSDVPEGD